MGGRRPCRRRRPRVVGALLAVVTALLVGACGDDESGKQAPRPGADGAPVEVREVDAPTPDDELTDELGDAGTTLTKAGCTFGTHEVGEPTHVGTDEDLDSPSFPPTSGPHYDDWAPFGLYDEPVADGYVVHNLEHGGVAVWLGTEVPDEVGAAVGDLLDDEEKWLVAPRPDITGLFSAAWGVGLSCPPEAVEQLGAQELADALDEWYKAVESTGSEAEKDIPAYAGSMKEPAPVRDISADPPTFG